MEKETSENFSGEGEDCLDSKWEVESGDEDQEEVEWATQDEPYRGSMDPAMGLRPTGSSSRFWGNGAESPPTSPAKISSSKSRLPDTTSLRRRADAAGLSTTDIDLAASMLLDSEIRTQVMSSSTPSDLDRQTTRVRKIVSTLSGNTKTSCGQWQGPLPAPRISPPLTIVDCPVRRVAGGHGRRRAGAVEFRNSNLDPVSSPGRSGPSPGFWAKVGPSWQRILLRSAVGRLLSRRGTLPIEFRH